MQAALMNFAYCTSSLHTMSNKIIGRCFSTSVGGLRLFHPSKMQRTLRMRPYSTDVNTVNHASSNSGLTLTDSCVEHLKRFATNAEFLRISVEGGGCSGFSYKFELDKEKGEDDVVFSRDGVQVVTDLSSLELIKGSKIDYETELIKSAFRVIENPQSTINCSCGVSFSIE